MILHAFVMALLLFPGYVVLHAGANRFSGPNGFIKTSTQLWLPYVGMAHLYFAYADPLLAASSLLFAMSFWCFYMLVLVAARNSVTLRMMDEIELAGGLTRSELDAKVPDGDSVEARLEAMARGGIIHRNGKELVLTDKGRKIGSLAIFVRKLFSLERAG